MSNKGEMDFPILTLLIIVGGLILLAPIILKVFTSIQTPMSAALGNMSDSGGVVAAENFNSVMNTATGFWDKIMIFAFFLALLLMLLSSFFIDTHPVWIILYIFLAFMVVIFSPNIIEALNTLYASSAFTSEVASLSFMDWVRVHLGEILIGFFLVSGVIIYGKIKFFGASGGGERR